MTASATSDGSKGTFALIVAAGRGTRFGGTPPKQYRALGGRAVLARSVRAFLDHALVDGVRVVIHPDDRRLYDTAVAGLDLPEPVTGGATRQQSVLNGLEALARHAPPRRVLIHDAARPLVDSGTITRVIAALGRHCGAIAATVARDSVKHVADGMIAGMSPPDALWLAQTPQAFRFAEILAAHRSLRGRALKDDADVAEQAGLRVAAVASDAGNFKITTEEDLARATRLAPRRTCVGTGFDVHRFGPGDGVILCGVAVPHGQALAGHSDADVALHAVVDALLGAVGGGDIGVAFPSNDAEWAGMDSARFLRHARESVAAAGGRIRHVDVTLICEAPRIAPYRAAMRGRLAGLLGLAHSMVSVKATTTDGLGFAGRREGIAAQATATVEVVE